MIQQEVQQYIDFHRENGGTGKIFQFKYVNYEPGTLTLEGNFTEACLNPNGTVQGGMMTSMLDDITSLLLIMEAKGKLYPASTDLHTLHHRAQKQGQVIAKATIMKKGKTIATVKGEIFDQDNKLITTLMHTAYLIELDRSLYEKTE